MLDKRALMAPVLEPNQIPFMQYGIINKANFNDKLLSKIPIKRWDPLDFNYGLNEKYGLYSYIYGHYSYISPIRADRPIERTKDVENEPSRVAGFVYDNHTDKSPVLDAKEGKWGRPPSDLFEPQILGVPYCEGESIVPAHSIVLSDGTRQVDRPFADHAKALPNLVGEAITMVNKFPAMARVIDPELLSQISEYVSTSDVNAKIAQGVCTVTIPRDYYTRVQDITESELACLFESMIAGIRYVIDEAVLVYNITSMPISPFFNVGKMVGGSLKRIHSQVYMDLAQDGHGTKTENILNAFENSRKGGQCHLCRSAHGRDDRVIIEDDQWIFFATGSPVRTFHLRFSPKEHLSHVGLLTKKALWSLSRMIRLIFAALDLLEVNPNRNIIWYTRPYGYNTDFHIFGDILPHEFIGGAEMADDMRVVRESPKDIAKKVRDAIKKL